MDWNPEVRKQLEEYIKNPAVLMSPDEEPYEYRQFAGAFNRMRYRRSKEIKIPFELFDFLLSHGVSQVELREFGSGLFLNYVDSASIYA